MPKCMLVYVNTIYGEHWVRVDKTRGSIQIALTDHTYTRSSRRKLFATKNSTLISVKIAVFLWKEVNCQVHQRK